MMPYTAPAYLRLSQQPSADDVSRNQLWLNAATKLMSKRRSQPVLFDVLPARARAAYLPARVGQIIPNVIVVVVIIIAVVVSTTPLAVGTA